MGYPYCDSSRVRFQIIRVLSRLPDRSMLGLHDDGKLAIDQSRQKYKQSYFSMEVAKLVTQPF